MLSQSSQKRLLPAGQTVKDNQTLRHGLLRVYSLPVEHILFTLPMLVSDILKLFIYLSNKTHTFYFDTLNLVKLCEI
jgi:hypothetical protein